MGSPEIIHDLNSATDPETHTVIIGGGINGLAIGNELVTRDPEHKVEIFDMSGANATIASGAQVYPFIDGAYPHFGEEDKEFLPYGRGYLPAILQHLVPSMSAYNEYAIDPNSGVARATVMELAYAKEGVDPIIQDLMDMRSEALELRFPPSYDRRGEALGEVHPLEGTGYDRYYTMASFSIDTLAHFLYLKKDFEDRGGVWHGRARVSRQALDTYDQGVVVVAAGHKEEELRPKHPFPLHKSLGMSAVFRTVEPLPPNPVLGFDKYLLRPHHDRHGITIGGFSLEDHYTDGKRSAMGRLKQEDSMRLVNECLEQVKWPFGPWEGLPVDLLRSVKPSIRYGVRSYAPFGPEIEQDRKQPNKIWVRGAGSIGMTLAHGLKLEAANVVASIHQNFKKGVPNPEKLFHETGDPDWPYEPHSSIGYRKRRPSVDVLQYSEIVNDVHTLMAAIALRKAVDKLHSAYRQLDGKGEV